MVSLAVEGALIFVVLHALAFLTLRLTAHGPEVGLEAEFLITSILFGASIIGTRTARLGGVPRFRSEVLMVSLASVVLGGCCFLALGGALDAGSRFKALIALEGAVTVPLIVAGWRWLSLRYKVLDGNRERVLLVGVGETSRQVCRRLVESHAHEFAVVGFAGDDSKLIGQVQAMAVRVLTDYASLPGFCEGRVDRVIVALDEKRGKLPIEQLMELRLRGVEVEEATTLFERVDGKIAVETMLPSWLIYSDGFRTSQLRSVAKRLTDVVLSALLLVLSFPLMVLTAMLVRVSSRGPVIFRQKRMGRGGREFELLKFRSMVADAENRSGPMWATQRDPRVTRVGRVIRLLRIDELPQLINVLRGEMSFVGPRPERRHFVEMLENEIPYYKLRITVRPGVTGWAQVQYGYGSTSEDALEKLKYDLFYIKNASPLFDLWIVLKTVKVVLSGAGR